ncbi:MAG TPA: carbon monoxide dehydrogenase subunit G [Stellaceae bacterium]|nr:carbon monoxide dehydrogenase subunit G [Stellaceae bacterium]
MDMTGEYRVAAPQKRVWDALNDPDILKQCISGCEEVQRISPTEFTAKVQARVGPVSARFGGKVTLSDLDPPNGYKISGEGTGGVAGFAKGGAEVHLTPDGDATKLSYKVTAQVGGKLAQIGSRLIDSTARKYADDFFAKFAAIVGAPAPAVAPAEAAPTAPQPPAPTVMPAQPEGKRLSPVVWAAILAALVAAMLYFFTR